MANASRPRKSSQPKTSSRGLSPKGTVPVSAGIKNRANAQLNKSPKVDPLELYVTLVAGAENLSVNSARALLRLRRAQLAAQIGAKGALVKVELRDGLLDIESSVACSPLLRDFFNLIVLQLVEDFPARSSDLRALLGAEKGGLDLSSLVRARNESGWHEVMSATAAKYNLATPLLYGTLATASEPIYAAIGAAMLRHRQEPLAKSDYCPICDGTAYAIQGRNYLCDRCAIAWPWLEEACPCCFSDKLIKDDGIQAYGVERLRCQDCAQEVQRFEKGLEAVFCTSPHVSLLRELEKRLERGSRL